MSFPKTTNVKENDYPAWKADWYDVRFDSWEEKKDKNDNTYTMVGLIVEDGGRPVSVNLSHNEDFLWKAKQFKAAIGMPDEATDLTPYVGTRLKVWIQNRVVKSRDTNEDMNFPDVRKFKPFGATQTEQSKPAGNTPSDLPWE